MNVFDLAARLTLDSSEYDRGLEDSSNKASSFGSKIGQGLATAAKVAGAALATAATAVGTMVKSSVEGFAEYEQLVGGLETMFEDLSYDVEENANRAFMTAGLSANEYMETVMGFSAALNQSLKNTEGNIARAADLSDQIIIDMADNANKMGTSMESIQTAYQGFAKQNYTMLDNLKLGYGGTKEEMERLLADASKLSGVEYDISNFSDIAEAIHVIQSEMGITGTTAKEASETISGSFASMKSAWQNLVVGFANGEADLTRLIGNVVSSAETVMGNVLPVVEQALAGIATFVEKIAPVVADKLPGVVETVLPSLLNAATTLVSALVRALPTIIRVLVAQGPVIINQLLKTILEMLPEIIDLGLTLIVTLADGIVAALPELVPALVDTILKIIDVLTDPGNLGMLIDASIAIIMALANGLIEALPRLLEKAPEIILNLVRAIIENVPKLLEAGWEVITTLVQGIGDNLGEIFNSAGRIIGELIMGLGSLAKDLWDAGKEAINSVWEGLTSLDPIQWGKDLINNFVDGIKKGWEVLKEGVKGIAEGVVDFLGFSEPKEGPLSNFHTFAPDMMELFAKGIRDNEHLVTDQLEKSLSFGEREIGLKANVSGSYAGGQSSGWGRNNTVTVNVYGAEGQSVEALAREVERVITRNVRTKEAAWA